MYKELTDLINNSANDDTVNVLILTGTGDFFCSGNDLSQQPTNSNSDTVEQILCLVKNYVNSLILYPKLSICIVNGPAIGIAVTTLALFDLVFASDKAYFRTPFTSLGLTAEGCSTYTFPKIMGATKACEMLYLGYKMDAAEAKERGLVTQVYKHNCMDEVWKHVENISSLPIEPIIKTKEMIRQWNKHTLLKANDLEIEVLLETYHKGSTYRPKSKI
ncbi:enoyl-CoA delta isomerase 2-like isoform X2 [Prorops nasuta]